MSDEDQGNGDKHKAAAGARPRTEHRQPVGAVLSDPRSGPPLRTARSRLGQAIGLRLSEFLVTLGILRRRYPDGSVEPRRWKALGYTTLAFFAIVFVWTSVHVVPPGNVAVPVTLGHEGKPIGAGLHITLPLTVTYGMSTRTQAYTMTSLKNEGPKRSTASSVTVLGSDGEAASVDATVLYRVDPKTAEELYTNVGRDYTTKIVRPAARNCIKVAFTAYTMVQGATSKFGAVSNHIETCMRAKVESVGLQLQDFQLREVTLSPLLQKAVDTKTAAQQNAEQQIFDTATARAKAQIAVISAQGNADANARLAGLSQNYLTLLYIQTLQQIINSGNATTVLLPSNVASLLSINPNGSVSATPPTGSSGSSGSSVTTTAPSSGSTSGTGR
jgi:regulator of protease activity HflC (stomatin/prohibitin superfamily)